MSTEIKVELNTAPADEASRSKKRRGPQIAWAKDEATGQLRYIGVLSRAQTGLKCGCRCYGCGDALEAVNAGRTDALISPHFRHATLAEIGACSKQVTKALLQHQLSLLKEVHLPARAVPATQVGLSGQRYTVSHMRKAIHMRVSKVLLPSEVEAILVLEDGSRLAISIEGRLEMTDEGTLVPTINIRGDDPLIATLAPEQLRERIAVLIGEGLWSGTDIDPHATDKALLEARRAAENALDSVPEEAVPEIGREASRETLLHWYAKEILSEIGQLEVPGLSVPWKDSYSLKGLTPRDCEVYGTVLSLRDAFLETRLGRTRPDVLAQAEGDPEHIWNGPLAIEVTVTNHIDEERLARIQAENIAFLEIDLSSIARNLDYDILARILTGESSLKSWLFHPGTAALEQQVLNRVDGGLLTATAKELAGRFAQLFVQSTAHPYYLEIDGQMDETLFAMDAELKAIGRELESRGYIGADIVKHRASIIRPLHRLFTLKGNKVVGYRVNTVWQVVNAIMGDMKGSSSRKLHVHYLMALKVYKPALDSPVAESMINAWRKSVVESCRNPEDEHYPNTRFNQFFSLLFPEINEVLQWRPRQSQT